MYKQGIITALALVLVWHSTPTTTQQTTLAYTVPQHGIAGDNLTLVCEVHGSTPGGVSWRHPPGTSDTMDVTENCDIKINNGSFLLSCEDTEPWEFRQYNLTVLHLSKVHHDGTWRCRAPGDSVPGSGFEDVNVSAIVFADRPLLHKQDYLVANQLNNITCGTNLDAFPIPYFTWWLSDSLEGGKVVMINDTHYDWEDPSDPGRGRRNTLQTMVHREHEGLYVWCQIIQGEFAPLESDKLLLDDIKYGPSNTTSLTPNMLATIPVDDQVHLACTVYPEDAGNPDHYEYIWTRQSDHNVTTGTNGSLTVEVLIENIDTYWCSADNGFGTAMPSASRLDVHLIPHSENQADSYQILNTDNNITVKCQFSSRPRADLTITGHKPTVFRVLDQVDEVHGDRDHLTRSWRSLDWATEDTKVRKEGTGVIQCEAVNEAGTGTTEVHIDVQFAPGKAELSITTKNVYIGGNVTMQCDYAQESDGNPSVDKYIFLEGGIIMYSGHETSWTWTPECVTQEGRYACQLGNSPAAGPQLGEISDAQTLHINVLPEILQPEGHRNVTTHYNETDLDIQCLAFGKPELDFDWYFNGELLQPDDSSYEFIKVYEEGNYSHCLTDGWRSSVHRGLSASERGCHNVHMYDGVYQCQASHPGHTSDRSHQITLTTLYPAFWHGDSEPVLAAAVGSDITLYCDVCVKPKGTILWYYDGQPIRTNITVSEDGSNITITNLLKEDFGVYTCNVTNTIHGQQYSKYFDIILHEQGKPHPPFGFKVEATTSFAVNVSWMPGFNGGFRQYFILHYRETGTEDYILWKEGISDSSTVINESIAGLKPDTAYEFQLHGYNENDDPDESESDKVYTHSFTKESPKLNVEKVVLESDHVTLMWTVLAGDPSSLTLMHSIDSSTGRVLMDDIPPHSLHVTVYEDFDLGRQHSFELLAFEPGGQEPSGGDDGGPVIIPAQNEGVDVLLILAIVVGCLSVLTITVTALAIHYRRKLQNTHDNEFSSSPHAAPATMTSDMTSADICNGAGNVETSNNSYTTLTRS